MPYAIFREMKKHTPALWMICFATFINRMGTMVLPFLIIYLTQKKGFSEEQASFVLGVFGFGALFTSLFGGSLGDWLGTKLTMTISLLGSALCLFIFPFLDGYFLILAVVILWSLLSEIVRPASMAAVTKNSTPELRQSAFAVYRLAINLGMSVGPLIAGFLVKDHFDSIFYIDGATSLLAALVVGFYYHQSNEERGVGRPNLPWKSIVNCLQTPAFVILCLLFLPILLAFAQNDSTLPLFVTQDLSLPATVVGLLATVNGVLIVLFEIPLNLKFAHWGIRKTFVVSAALFALSMVSLAISFGIWFLIFSAVLWTFAEILLFSAASSYLSELIPPDQHTGYMGVYVGTHNLTNIVGPIVGVWVMVNFGARPLWFALAAVCLISFFGALRWLPKPSIT